MLNDKCQIYHQFVYFETEKVLIFKVMKIFILQVLNFRCIMKPIKIMKKKKKQVVLSAKETSSEKKDESSNKLKEAFIKYYGKH